MRRLYYTADVDRDVNVQVPGRVAAGSLDRGSGDAPRFSSSDAGLGAILDVLDDLGVRGTLFFEGRTSEVIDCARASGHSIGVHGYDHEDLTSLDAGSLEDTVRKAVAAVTDRVGRPTCSRAPYMTASPEVLAAHRRAGIRRDSSTYTEVGVPSAPRLECDMIELPVSKSRDRAGKVIAAYLWPMHEGRRSPSDYMDMAARTDGDVVIADHSWHMVETRESGVMDADGRRRASEEVREVLEGILDLGFRPATLRSEEVPRPGVGVDSEQLEQPGDVIVQGAPERPERRVYGAVGRGRVQQVPDCHVEAVLVDHLLDLDVGGHSQGVHEKGVPYAYVLSDTHFQQWHDA